MHRVRAALRRRFGRAAGIAIAALVLPLMPASCLCAPAPSTGAVAHHDCHGNAPARPPAHANGCQRCQAVIAPTAGPQTPAAPAPIAFATSSTGIPTALAPPAPSVTPVLHRSGHPPARVLLLQKHVLII